MATGDRGARKLLERSSVLNDLKRGARDAASGNGSLTALRAGAGLGKTSLLEELAGRAEQQGLRVLTARGVQLERDFAFGIVHQLFDALLVKTPAADRGRIFAGAAALAEPLFGGTDSQPSDATGFATMNGLWWMLAAVALDGPLALLVDDFQWADWASARWLGFLAPRIAEIPALVVIAARPEELGAPPEWGALAAAAIELTSLSDAGTEALLADRLGAQPAPEFVEACQASTGGNPFLLTELTRELAAREVAPSRAEAAVVARVAPDTVARSVIGRLGSQPAAVGQLAIAVAVLGDDVGLPLASALAGIAETDAREAADKLIELGILRHADALRFEHPIVRDAVYESIGPSHRAGMHATAAELLAGRGDTAERRAMHLVRTEPRGEQAVVDTLRAAAAAAAAGGSHDLAVDYLSRALAEPPRSSERPALLGELGHAETLIGRPEALGHLREALSEAEDPAVRDFAAGELARTLQLTGDLDGAIAVVDERRRHGDDATAALAVETELLTVGVIAGGEPWERLRPRLRALQDDAAAGGPAGQALLALLALDEVRSGGSYAAAGRLARAALADDVLLARGSGYPPFLIACYVAVRCGETELASDVLNRAIVSARREGSLLGFSSVSLYRGIASMIRESDLDSAEADYRAAIEAARDNGWPLLEWQAMGFLLMLFAERGEIAEAQAELERGGYEGELPVNGMANALLNGRASVRYAQGRWRDAYEDFIECGRREAPFTDRSQATWWRTEAARSLAHLGQWSEARALAEAEVAIQLEFGDPVAMARAFGALGIAKGEEGIGDLQEAVARLEGVSDYYLSSALIDLGAALRRSKRRSESRAPLRRGLELADRIGMPGNAERARTELAASGARARSVLRTGVDSLTPSELRIARLAAGGLTNPQIAQELFVARKTVEKHLASVFAKLAIASRTELPAALEQSPRPAHAAP